MNKKLIFGLCLVVLIGTVGCSKKTVEKDEKSTQNSTQMENPFIESDSIKDAEKLADFEMSLPNNMPEGFKKENIRVIEKNMIEVIYANQGLKSKIIIRKGKADKNEAISGDYNEYSENKTIKVDDLKVKTRGENGKINVAEWSDGDFLYSINVTDLGNGLSEKATCAMIKKVK